MEPLRISVTAADIQAGGPNDPAYCPIARAVRRLGLKKKVRVWNDSLLLDSSSYELPERAVLFIDRFDDGHRVRPFTFTLTRKKE